MLSKVNARLCEVLRSVPMCPKPATFKALLARTFRSTKAPYNREIAAALGIHENTVSVWRSGPSLPPRFVMSEICHVLADLIEWKSTSPKAPFPTSALLSPEAFHTELLKLYASGLTHAQVAERSGASRDTVINRKKGESLPYPFMFQVVLDRLTHPVPC